MPDSGTMAPSVIDVEPMTSDELQAWRRARGMRQPDLAARLEIPLGTLRNYEQGHRPVPALMRRALNDIDRELEDERRAARAHQAGGGGEG